jgi:NTP pyrophosphatase (non-canonical NTP hydrolase)
MTLAEYAEWQEKTDLYNKNPNQTQSLLMLYALGLNGESGEVAELVKRVYRDGNYNVDSLKKELGDVFWYLSRIATWAGLSMQDVIDTNVAKITDRHERGVGHGSGGDR